MQAASRADDGCVAYGYHREIVDDMAFIAVEEWRDMAALEAHLRQPHVARLIAALPEHAAAPVEIAAHTVAQTGSAAAASVGDAAAAVPGRAL